MSGWREFDRNAPLALHCATVLPEYIDHNQHMNLAYYVLIFDQATDGFFDYIGLDHDYRMRELSTTFTLEAHTLYLRELKLGASVCITTQLLDADSKRLHYFHRMYHKDEGYLAATQELLSMHVDTMTRRGSALPESTRMTAEDLLRQHRRLDPPEQAGHVIGIRHRSSTKQEK